MYKPICEGMGVRGDCGTRVLDVGYEEEALVNNIPIQTGHTWQPINIFKLSAIR